MKDEAFKLFITALQDAKELPPLKMFQGICADGGIGLALRLVDAEFCKSVCDIEGLAVMSMFANFTKKTAIAELQKRNRVLEVYGFRIEFAQYHMAKRFHESGGTSFCKDWMTPQVEETSSNICFSKGLSPTELSIRPVDYIFTPRFKILVTLHRL